MDTNYIIPASKYPFDVWKLGVVGGWIEYREHGAVFVFETKQSYIEYQEIKIPDHKV